MQKLFFLLALGTPLSWANTFRCNPITQILNFSETDFHWINYAELQNREALNSKSHNDANYESPEIFRGRGHLALENATYRDREVFVKYPNRHDNLEQVRRYKIMGDIGIGPHFYGISRNPEGKLAIVMERIPGILFWGSTDKISDAIHISMDTYRQTEAIEKKLYQIGFGSGYDLQLRITPEGKVYLIDPEFLHPIPPVHRHLPPEIAREFKVIRENLQRILESRGLWKK